MTEMLPAGSAVITPNQMYHEMQEIGRKVDHLSSILDPALAQLRTDLTEVEKRIEVIKAERVAAITALELRMRTLENWRWFVVGAATVLGTAAGYGGSLLGGAL